MQKLAFYNFAPCRQGLYYFCKTRKIHRLNLQYLLFKCLQILTSFIGEEDDQIRYCYDILFIFLYKIVSCSYAVALFISQVPQEI